MPQSSQHSSSSMVPELIWTEIYQQSQNFEPSQLHNHIKNSHLITTKNTFHELQSANGSNTYPLSFLMPGEYENFCGEYEWNIFRIVLRDLSERIWV